VKACGEVDLEFADYRGGTDPDCFCKKVDGERVLMW